MRLRTGSSTTGETIVVSAGIGPANRRMPGGSLNPHEISAQLYVSRNTVKSQTRALYRKLGAASRSEAVRIDRSRGMA